MKKSTLLCTLAVGLCFASVVLADLVVTKDGSRLAGTITGIDGGTITLTTAFAGTIQISQDEVASFETETPIVVRLQNGTVMEGPVQASEDGKLRIKSEDGVLETSTAKVATTWAPGSEDPAIARTRKKWKYNASLDLNGKSGNTDKFRLGTSLDAELKGPDDELAFFFEYEQAEEEDSKTEDRVAGGSSYESFFSGQHGWYARTELESDNVDNVKLRSTTAAGLSYRFINKSEQTLVGRSGLGYRYTGYDNTITEDESSATIDFGLAHMILFGEFARMENEITLVPAINEFSVFRVVHDSGLEVPFGSGPNWKLRFGIKNEYDSEPATDEKLDTSYYTKMVYSWD